MENKEYQDEFELFLNEETKQHRMYPSDHIWKNIRTELHGYRAWPALTFISLFIITALTISTLLNNHPDQFISPNQASNTQMASQAKQSANGTASGNYFQQIAADQITANTFAGSDLQEASFIQSETDIAVLRKPMAKINPVIALNRETNAVSSKNRSSRQTVAASPIAMNISSTLPAIAEVVPTSLDLPLENEGGSFNTQKLFIQQTESHAATDKFLSDFHFTSNTPVRQRNSKFGYQLYITPSTSYRRLSDEVVKDVIQPASAAQQAAAPSSVNYSASLQDVNNVVRHRPAIGWEVGFGLLYNISDRFKFKTGIQLNIRQYYIETFQSTYDLASLSLVNYRGIETINFYSSYNNNTGFRKAQLENKVYQVSVPIGIQWDIIRGKYFGINTEASVQPTFTLNNSTYLLSTDYKHYTTGGDFIRKWNINTSLGINLTYSTGFTTWQLGPQVRYQHLPTFSNLYPVKEYLMDYGIRLGVTRQIR